MGLVVAGEEGEGGGLEEGLQLYIPIYLLSSAYSSLLVVTSVHMP